MDLRIEHAKKADQPEPGWHHIEQTSEGRRLAHVRDRVMPLSEEPTFSLIILNKDGGEVLERVFESICDHFHGHSFEILVVDHDSQDGSRQVIDRWGGRLALRTFFQPGNNTFSFVGISS